MGPPDGVEAFTVGGIEQPGIECGEDAPGRNALVVRVEAARHRRHLGALERRLGRRRHPHYVCGVTDQVLRWRRFGVGEIVGARELGEGGKRGDAAYVLDMDEWRRKAVDTTLSRRPIADFNLLAERESEISPPFADARNKLKRTDR